MPACVPGYTGQAFFLVKKEAKKHPTKVGPQPPAGANAPPLRAHSGTAGALTALRAYFSPWVMLWAGFKYTCTYITR